MQKFSKVPQTFARKLLIHFQGQQKYIIHLTFDRFKDTNLTKLVQNRHENSGRPLPTYSYKCTYIKWSWFGWKNNSAFTNESFLRFITNIDRRLYVEAERKTKIQATSNANVDTQCGHETKFFLKTHSNSKSLIIV